MKNPVCLAQVGFKLSPASSNPPSLRITNAHNASPGDFPYQISYQRLEQDGWKHLCGGSIISPTWILTAAHCITQVPQAGEFRVVAGIVNLNGTNPERQEIPIAERWYHPQYSNNDGPNDIAVFKLAKPLVFGALVQAIRLPGRASTAPAVGVLSGWGSVSLTSTAEYPIHLQTIVLPILSNDVCKDAVQTLLTSFVANPYSADSNLCTGPLHGGFTACSGDSGGPLAQNGTVYGVVSWGFIPCGKDGAPTVYTRVSNFRDFIESYVKDLPNE